MNNEPPACIVIENFSDLKHKINNKWSKQLALLLLQGQLELLKQKYSFLIHKNVINPVACFKMRSAC